MGTLTDPRLIEALHKRGDDGELLKLAIGSCFVNPNAAQYVNESWPATVKGYEPRPNSDELIDEKATILPAFVVHNLDAAIEARKELNAAGFSGTEQELTQEQIILLKVEEAACWYRVTDELAYRFIREHRPLFTDYFLDTVARLLALQGLPPALICRTMADRSQEYGQYREWYSSDDSRMAGTLLWHAAKHVGMPFGFERHFMFNRMFGILFLKRVKQALHYELLTGKLAGSEHGITQPRPHDLWWVVRRAAGPKPPPQQAEYCCHPAGRLRSFRSARSSSGSPLLEVDPPRRWRAGTAGDDP